MAQLMDDEREYYSLVKKVFDILAPFYDMVTTPLSRLRGRGVDFTGAEKGSKYWMLPLEQVSRPLPLRRKATMLPASTYRRRCLR